MITTETFIAFVLGAWLVTLTFLLRDLRQLKARRKELDKELAVRNPQQKILDQIIEAAARRDSINALDILLKYMNAARTKATEYKVYSGPWWSWWQAYFLFSGAALMVQLDLKRQIKEIEALKTLELLKKSGAFQDLRPAPKPSPIDSLPPLNPKNKLLN